MLLDHATSDGVLMPHELDMLQGILNRAVNRFGYCRDGLEAQVLATTMIDLYRRGLKDEAKLKILFAA